MSENKNNKLIPMDISVESLKEKIYMVRGQQVMLDADLAEIYGYTTKTFNQQVKNNLEKFDEDFRFQLTPEEAEDLRSKFLTANINSKSRYEPYVFTESGIYMLMTVLKGDLAIRQSKALIQTFKKMKDYIIWEPLMSEKVELVKIALQLSENTKDISDIKETMITKDDLTKVMRSFSIPDKGIEYVIYAGRTFEADAAYADIYSKAKKQLFIIDNYIGPKTLLMLKSVPSSVSIIIFSDNLNNILRLSELQTFQKEYPAVKLSFQKTGGKFHDRYIVVDYKSRAEKIYHCGASSKDAGKKITTITQSDNRSLYHPMIEELLKRPSLQLK